MTPAEATSTRNRYRSKILSVSVVTITLVWAGFLLKDGITGAFSTGIAPKPLVGMAAFALLVVSLAVSLPTFWYLIVASGARPPSYVEFARLHFSAQLMKHLPGRFVGVVYQSIVASHVATTAQWVGANISLMLVTLWFSIFIPTLVLYIGGLTNLLILAAAFSLLIIAPLGALALERLTLLVGTRRRAFAVAVQVAEAIALVGRKRETVVAFIWMAASWLVYLAAWALFGFSIDGIGYIKGMELCAFYSIAWAIGFMSIVAPSGLGVRELAFVTLADSYPPDLVVAVAVIARVSMISADMLMGLAMLPWKRNAS